MPQKNENFNKAKKLFHLIKQRSDYIPSQKISSAYLFTLCETGRINQARDFFEEMVGSDSPPSLYDYNTVIKMYTRNNRIGFAVQVFEEMVERGLVPNVVVLERMVRQTARAGLIKKSLFYLGAMCERKIVPHKFTLEPLIRKTKGYPHHWVEIKEMLGESGSGCLGLSWRAVDLYFPPVRPMKRVAKEVVKRSVRLRVGKPSPPRQSKKRPKVKEIVISRY